jgi:hypothetical protein
MDELHGDSTLVTLTDNQYYTGLLREPVSLVAPYYTRIGIEYVSDVGDGYFFTQIRDYDSKKVSIKITIVTSYGHNDQHCRAIVEAISDLFSIDRKKVTSTYKIYIDNINTNIVETEQARWIGTVTMDIAYLTLVPTNLE